MISEPRRGSKRRGFDAFAEKGRKARTATEKKSMKRCYSLKRNKEFRRVYRHGKSAGSHLLVLIHTSARQPDKRIGLVVGKKIGSAVVRNRVKRRLREAVTPLLPRIHPGCRLIFIARAPITDASFKELESTVRRLLTKAGLIG